MLILKKLIFAPVFLIVFILLIFNLTPFLKSYDFIFSLSLSTFINLISISLLISFSSLLFTLLTTLAQDWRISIPVAVIGAIIPFGFIDPSLSIVFAVGISVSLLLTNLNLDVALKSYLNFQPTSLLGPPIRHLTGLLILTICVVYFFSASKIIAQNGFSIPDSLIDTALKMTPLDIASEQNPATSQLSQISQEQLDLLRKNPEMIRQSGLDPKLLDNLSIPQTADQAPTNLLNDTIKQTVKDQIQGFIKPYQNLIPIGLAIMLFLTLQSLTSILNLLVYPLLWLIFFILEKTGFVRFEVEQRPVKKLVV